MRLFTIQIRFGLYVFAVSMGVGCIHLPFDIQKKMGVIDIDEKTKEVVFKQIPNLENKIQAALTSEISQQGLSNRISPAIANQFLTECKEDFMAYTKLGSPESSELIREFPCTTVYSQKLIQLQNISLQCPPVQIDEVLQHVSDETKNYMLVRFLELKSKPVTEDCPDPKGCSVTEGCAELFQHTTKIKTVEIALEGDFNLPGSQAKIYIVKGALNAEQRSQIQNNPILFQELLNGQQLNLVSTLDIKPHTSSIQFPLEVQSTFFKKLFTDGLLFAITFQTELWTKSTQQGQCVYSRPYGRISPRIHIKGSSQIGIKNTGCSHAVRKALQTF